MLRVQTVDAFRSEFWKLDVRMELVKLGICALKHKITGIYNSARNVALNLLHEVP